MSANLALLAASPRPWSLREQRLIDDSRDAVGRMTRLIEQLLSTARADGAHIDSSADLSRAVRRACQTARARHEFPHGALRLRLPAQPVVVIGAEDLIAEQILNLIDNAFHHGAPPVIVHVKATGAVCVWDHGQGVDEATLPHLTDRFFRAASTQASGSGLGLAIVHTLAEAQTAQFELGNRGLERTGLVGKIAFQLG